MERKIMNNWEINNSENMRGDPAISEMEFYSTMAEDEDKSNKDDTSKDIPVQEVSDGSDTKPVEGSEPESKDIPEESLEETSVEINNEEEVEEATAA